jgi:acetylglutamate kinase
MSGKDAALLRAKPTGELAEVNHAFLESLLQQSYIPVITPIGIGHDGRNYPLSDRDVAAGIAQAIHADKLVFLSDAIGITDGGELVTELAPAELRARIDSGAIANNLAATGSAALRALAGGVRAVHLLDGRTPHTVIAELFTDTGVGTIVRAES